jgi:hypothetical protein
VGDSSILRRAPQGPPLTRLIARLPIEEAEECLCQLEENLITVDDLRSAEQEDTEGRSWGSPRGSATPSSSTTRTGAPSLNWSILVCQTLRPRQARGSKRAAAAPWWRLSMESK